MTIRAQILEFPDWRVFRRRSKTTPGWEAESRNSTSWTGKCLSAVS